MDYLKELKIKFVKTKIKNPLKGQIKQPNDLVKIFKDLETSDKEKVISLHLNARQIPNCFEVLSIGGVDLALVSAKDVFKGVLLTNSTGFILVHNHPSGDPTPSKQDQEIIKKLEKQAKIMEIDFIDFIIVGDNKFWSWRFKKE
ncbi:hypothetical protein CL633_00900 [bacterium]|nr:hypothetical protein [bacterium]|tara:strand:- start:298 stop:729 length:432 start_codon:yes stop_codon:yes gene_type:complete